MVKMNGCAAIDSARPFRFLADKAAVAADFHLENDACYHGKRRTVLRILWMGSSVIMLIRAALEALCAFWMIGLGLSWLRKDWKTPTRSLTPAVLGSAVFYWCVLARFMENSSSWHRVAPTAMVWQLLAGLMFLSALARALYLPGTSDGRTLCAGGLAAFALCLCWELPTVLQTLVQEGGGALLTPTLLFRLGLCCVGALGALSAVRCTRTEQDA